MGVERPILTINSGSSSIRFSVWPAGAAGARTASGKIDSIGLKGSSFTAQIHGGQRTAEEGVSIGSHAAALRLIFDWLGSAPGAFPPAAVGHRVVHGGHLHTTHKLITTALVDELRRLVPFAPEHLPHEIEAIEAVSVLLPGASQTACFDTAFHATMPKVSRMYAIPRSYYGEGVMRYGFHGLSYEYVLGELGRLSPEMAAGRVVIAHLGNGASLAAVKGGRPFDTTMGFTPVAGLMMSRRTGDLDPGIIIYLMREKGMDADEINSLINTRSGLLGVSGLSTDMRDLLAAEKSDARAKEAVELFCHCAVRSIGAVAATLGGLDSLVFTGGIGENSPEIRERIAGRLGFLGVRLDRVKNSSGSPLITEDNSPAQARVIRTDEEIVIARHTARLAREG